MANISVIIPTYNSAYSLDVCLKSISEQKVNVEVIIADRFSTDKTAEISELYAARLLLRDCERAEAKNLALQEATSPFIFFMDSDMELTPGVLEQCLRAMEDPTVGGVIVPERSVGNGFWVKVRDFERSFYEGTAIESARFFRRELALKVGGFNEEVVFFEESILPQNIKKLGYRVNQRIASPILHHEENFSLFKWLKKKAYYGKTARRYRDLNSNEGKEQMSYLSRMSMFTSSRRFYKKPILATGVLLLKSLEFSMAGYGYIRGE